MDEKIYYSISDLENLLQISKPTIHKLLNEKLFHWVKIGSKVFISKDSFDQWFYGSGSE